MSFVKAVLKWAPVPIRRRGRSFGGDERASTAIEFGILAVPFFAIIGAILETSMVFLAGQVLDTAVQDATRKVVTGQAQSGTIGDFRTAICNGLYNLFDCTKIKIKMEVISTFNNTSASVISSPIAPPPCNAATDPQQCWRVTETYAPGTGSSIVLVQVFYKWPIIVNFGGVNLANQPDGTRLLATVRVFRNEPFN